MVDKPIKSVQRVFEILELFDQERGPIAAKDVSKRLGYPLMSTHELLKSMQKLGYADFDPDARTYTPSFAVPALVEWVRDYFSVPTKILDFMSDLSEQTRETCNLSRRVGLKVKIGYGLESKYSFGVSVRVGTAMPLAGSLTGLVSLAAQEDDAVDATIEKIRASHPVQLEADCYGEFPAIRRELMQTGMVCRSDLMVQGVGAVCMPIHIETLKEIAVIGVVGPSDRIVGAALEHQETLTKLVRRHRVKPYFPIGSYASVPA